MRTMIYTALDAIIGTIIAPSVAANDADRKARLTIHCRSRSEADTSEPGDDGCVRLREIHPCGDGSEC